MRPLLALLRRDLRLALREGAAVGTALGFYLIVVVLVPMSIGPEPGFLSRLAPGLLWVLLLLAALLSLGQMFDADMEDGTLEVMATAAIPLEAVVAVKSLAHWLSTGVPLVLLAPLLGLLLALDLRAFLPLVATMLAGTLTVSFLGAIGAALTLRTRRGGLLVALLVLPLYVPTLIYGIAAVTAASLSPAGFVSPFLIVLALSLGSMVLGPIAAAAALRVQMQ